MTAENIASLLEKKRFRVILKRAELAGVSEIAKADFLLLASPTYGHGQLQEHMSAFLKRMNTLDLKGMPCAAIGLGDPKYEAQYHIESAPVLERFLESHGGKLILPALRISRTPVMHLKGLIPHWTQQLISAL
jgi:flavodoxin